MSSLVGTMVFGLVSVATVSGPLHYSAENEPDLAAGLTVASLFAIAGTVATGIAGVSLLSTTPQGPAPKPGTSVAIAPTSGGLTFGFQSRF